MPVIMKKFLAAILAIIYLSVSSGATIHFHYCMGKMMSWDMSTKNKNNCGNCGMEKASKKGCCHDEQKQLKVEKDQKNAEPVFLLLAITSDATNHLSPCLPELYLSIPAVNNFSAHAPPAHPGIAVYLRNCNFRI